MNWPTKIFAGTSGNINVPQGSVLLHLKAVATSGGSIIGVPDAQGGSATVTVPTGSQWWTMDPGHMGIIFRSRNNPGQGLWLVVFSSTNSYFLEVANPQGF
jgi:hypothetical protein